MERGGSGQERRDEDERGRASRVRAVFELDNRSRGHAVAILVDVDGIAEELTSQLEEAQRIRRRVLAQQEALLAAEESAGRAKQLNPKPKGKAMLHAKPKPQPQPQLKPIRKPRPQHGRAAAVKKSVLCSSVSSTGTASNRETARQKEQKQKQKQEQRHEQEKEPWGDARVFRKLPSHLTVSTRRFIEELEQTTFELPAKLPNSPLAELFHENVKRIPTKHMYMDRPGIFAFMEPTNQPRKSTRLRKPKPKKTKKMKRTKKIIRP